MQYFRLSELFGHLTLTEVSHDKSGFVGEGPKSLHQLHTKMSRPSCLYVLPLQQLSRGEWISASVIVTWDYGYMHLPPHLDTLLICSLIPLLRCVTFQVQFI